MNNSDKQIYIKRYNKRLTEFGYDTRSLGWGGGQERQFLRFKKAIDFINFSEHKISSVLDVGCGFGDLGNWLSDYYPSIEYTGIDINTKLIDIGVQKFKLNLLNRDLFDIDFDSFDLVVSNGIFNAELKHEDQIEYLEKYLNSFFSICRFGFVADFMSNFVDFKQHGAYHTKEEDVLNIIKKFSKRYIIRNDYLDYEYMIYVFK